MRAPDSISRRVCKPISSDAAARILRDCEVCAECARLGVDLGGLMRNLQLTARQRVKGADSESTSQNVLALLDELTRRKIKFVLIGGLAGRIYGTNHSTIDLDVCHSRDAENLELLAGMLRDLKAEFRRAPQFAPAALTAETLASETDFVFNTRYGYFDLIGEFTGVGRYCDAIEGAISVKLIRRYLRVLSLPKLAAAKESTGRLKDQLVHRELELTMRIYDKIDAGFGVLTPEMITENSGGFS